MKKVVSVVLMMILLLPCMVKAETLDVSLDKAETIMKSLTDVYISNENLFSKDSYIVDSISKSELIGSAMKVTYDELKPVSACKDESKRTSITTDQFINKLNEGLKKYFINKTVSMDDIKKLSSSSPYKITYGKILGSDVSTTEITVIDEGTSVKLLSPCDGQFSSEPYAFGKIEKALEDDNYVYVYQKVVFAKYSDSNDWKGNSDTYVVDGYKDYARKEKRSTFKREDTTKIDYSYYNTYKYTFKKQDGKYYFTRVENMKDAKEYKVSTAANTNTKKTTTKKVSNPNTADKNILMLLATGIIMFVLVLHSGKKLFLKK